MNTREAIPQHTLQYNLKVTKYKNDIKYERMSIRVRKTQRN